MNSSEINIKDIVRALPISIKAVLQAIDKNSLGILFLVDNSGYLIGTITDGDIRRALIAGESPECQLTINSKIFNHSPHFLFIDSEIYKFWELFNKGFHCVPILDHNKLIVDFATPRKINNFPIMTPLIGDQEKSNVLDCITSGWISSQGKYIVDFESNFEEYLGGGHAVAVSNGTVALQLALSAIGIQAGDEVILPNYTFGACINAVINVGAIPILVDVSEENWTINVDVIENKITSKTKAIMPVHLFGQPSNMLEINNIALKYHLFVIEDCAEALGSSIQGKIVGLWGDCSCFSFFANKNITTGEGGMVVFKNKDFAEKAKILRDHGMSKSKRYWHEEVGFNYRMTNIQAGIGVAQLSRIESLLKMKKLVFDSYDNFFANEIGFELLPKNDWSKNAYWLYAIVLRDHGYLLRDKLIKKLNNKGIDARPGFYPLNEMPPFKKYDLDSYPCSKYLSENTICLPSSFDLSFEDISYIAKTFIAELLVLNND
jgi:perosamine synthetase